MQLVQEQLIDALAEQIGASETQQQQVFLTLQETQPVVLAYLFSETFDLFTKEEQAYMLFIVFVLWKSIEQGLGEIPEVSEKAIGDADEYNWELFQQSKATRFRDQLDAFFEGYPQEDLLAFVEDALIDEEEGIITKEGRAPLFIACKSVLDCFLQITPPSKP